MKNPDIYFMPLGGGQNVGASCYFLRLGNANIILDAGTGRYNRIPFEPDFMSVMTLPFILSLNQISRIFISHAHLDHTGCLLKLMKSAEHSEVYMTEPTKFLTEHQLYDRKFFSYQERNSDEDQRLAAQYLLQKITCVNYMQTINFGDYSASFFQAGHIPGAMMTMLTFKDRKILYTGDYSLHSTALTDGCIIPDDIEIDTLIMCGLHAKHPNYRRRSDSLYRDINSVMQAALYGQNVICHVSQLSKGIEFIKILNSCNEHHIPIFIDDGIMNTIAVMDKLSEPVLTADNHHISEIYNYGNGITITSSGYKNYMNRNAIEFHIDFSIHEDFTDMKKFIQTISPHHAVIVHCAPALSDDDITIEQEIMKDHGCRTQFTFAENGQLYIL